MLGQLLDGSDVGSGLALDLDAFVLRQPRRLEVGLVAKLDDFHSDAALECDGLFATGTRSTSRPTCVVGRRGRKCCVRRGSFQGRSTRRRSSGRGMLPLMLLDFLHLLGMFQAAPSKSDWSWSRRRQPMFLTGLFGRRVDDDYVARDGHCGYSIQLPDDITELDRCNPLVFMEMF